MQENGKDYRPKINIFFVFFKILSHSSIRVIGKANNLLEVEIVFEKRKKEVEIKQMSFPLHISDPLSLIENNQVSK